MTTTTHRPKLVARELLDEVNWLLDGGVHPLLIAQTLGKSCQSIDRAARVHGDQRIARLFAYPAQQERDRNAARRRQQVAA